MGFLVEFNASLASNKNVENQQNFEFGD